MDNKSDTDLKEIEAKLIIEQENKKRRLLKEVKSPKYTCFDWVILFVSGVLIFSSLSKLSGISGLTSGILFWAWVSQQLTNRRINALIELLNEDELLKIKK